MKAKSLLLMNGNKQMRCKANNWKPKLKREHFSSKIEANKGNIKETWKTINQLANNRSNTTEISTIKEGNRVISDPTEIADSMNQFFCSVGKDLSDKIPNKENPLLTGNYGKRKKDVEKFAFVPVNPENVLKACRDFKTSNGYDKILSLSSFSRLASKYSLLRLHTSSTCLFPPVAFQTAGKSLE